MQFAFGIEADAQGVEEVLALARFAGDVSAETSRVPTDAG